MKKKILIVLGVILLLFICLIAYYVVVDLNQEKKLKKELDEIYEMTNQENIDVDKIYERLDKIVTKDDYAKVEEAFKQYLKDNFDNSLKIAEILSDERLVTILTANNYLEDGKEFIETKKYIETTRNELENKKKKYNEFFTEEKAMSYIENKNLDSYYVDLYKDEFVGDIESENDDKTVENSINDIIELLDISEEVINLLANNPDSWEINGEYIEFNNNSLSEQYDELINKLS